MMMRIASTIGLGVALSLAAAQAGMAQDPRLERLAADARQEVGGIIDSARAAGLPAEPLIDRALEGASKHAPAPLIATAVRRLAADLGRARDALGRSALPAELASAADALRAGASPHVVRRLRDALGGRSLAVPLGVLADLAARGVPADTGASLVLAVARSVADQDLLALQREVERDIALGVAPLAAAGSFLEAAADAPALPASGTRAIERPPTPRKP
jgi:hypothetical protein